LRGSFVAAVGYHGVSQQPNLVSNGTPCCVLVFPKRNGWAVFGKRLELSKWSVRPNARPYDYWHNDRFAFCVALHGRFYINAPAVFTRKKIGANQKNNQICALQLMINFIWVQTPLCTDIGA
jgi:hypothetical protein